MRTSAFFIWRQSGQDRAVQLLLVCDDKIYDELNWDGYSVRARLHLYFTDA